MQPARAPRDTAIAAVLLMDAQIDHVTGLLSAARAPAGVAAICHGRGARRLEQRVPPDAHVVALLWLAVAHLALRWHAVFRSAA
ncbi:MBL fold metallo-hydrolase [Cupriavidus basilensis]